MQSNNLCLFSENAGLLGLTRVGSRRVIQISAGFMFFFSVLGVCYIASSKLNLPDCFSNLDD